MAEMDNRLSLDNMLAGLGPALFASIRAPFGIFDKNFKIVWINKSMAMIHHCDPVKVIGEFCYDALRGCDSKCDACFLKEVIVNGRTQVVERSMDFPGGRRRWGEVHAYPVRGTDKNVSAVIIIVFEITANKDALQRQKNYTELLEHRLSKNEGGPKKVDLDHGEIAISVKLSRRETDVLRLITEGYTNMQISELLDISANTVKSYVISLFNKLGVNDRTQAAVLATRNRII
jgi:PAS domain S-box-containing protein